MQRIAWAGAKRSLVTVFMQINTSDSPPLLAKARAWLASLSDWSSAETPNSVP